MMLRRRVTLRLGEPGHGRPLTDGINYPTASRQTSVRDSAPEGPSGMHGPMCSSVAHL
jgi:hypothetical protein